MVRALHAKLLEEFGGLPGPPRLEALEDALARPQTMLGTTLGLAPTAGTRAALAAAYGYALAHGRCFADGNKRIALAVIDVFLQLNGYELTASAADAASAMRALAGGALSERELADWIDAHSRPLPQLS
jgi:death on curing protein